MGSTSGTIEPAQTRKIRFNFSEDMKYHLEENNGGKKCVTWYNIPITRVDTNITDNKAKTDVVEGLQNLTEAQPPMKRVTWNENLLEVRDISPRICQNRFRFPDPKKSSPLHQQGYLTPSTDKEHSHPYARQLQTTHLRCSPQLQAVVEKARAIRHSPQKEESNGYQWKSNNVYNYNVRETII